MAKANFERSFLRNIDSVCLTSVSTIIETALARQHVTDRETRSVRFFVSPTCLPPTRVAGGGTRHLSFQQTLY